MKRNAPIGGSPQRRRGCRLAAGTVLLAMAVLTPGHARAQDPLLITLGAHMVSAPRFEGARRHELSPWPIISWRRQSDREWLDLPTDGLDLALIETDSLRAGPVGFLRWQRDSGAIAQRGFARIGHGHNVVDLSVEAGAFIELWPAPWLRTRLEVREAVLGASGLLGILSADLVWRADTALTLAAGPRLSLADRRFMRDYYGIDGAQALTTGLPTHEAGAGLRSVGAGAFVRYKLAPAWTTQAFVDYQHLTGSAADSPVITTRGKPEQVMVGVGLSYTFKAPW